VLSRRILVFTAKEVFFYCPNGVLSESFSMGSDRYESIPPTNMRSIKLCGLLNTSRTNQLFQSISACVEHYNRVYLQLLNFYIGKVLTHDDDVLNAFSGVINAQLGMLGQCYWGLPQRLFARALLQSRTINPYTMRRRPGFPSWSWLGWKLDQPRASRRFYKGMTRPLLPLVYIYKHDAQSSLELLVGPIGNQATEGCSVGSIDHYNTSTQLDPLPTLPCIENVPKVSQLSGQESLPLLLFWTHVARLTPSDFDDLVSDFEGTMVFDNSEPLPASLSLNECGLQSVHVGSAQIEVILIAMTDPDAGDSHFHGIVIERHLGYARRIGTVLQVPSAIWLAANPKKELILLI
jgi:hypothetical protein